MMIRTTTQTSTNNSRILSECFLGGIRKVLGDSPTKAVLFRVQFTQCIDDPEGFHRNLTSIFGEPAAIIEKAMIKELFQRIGLPYEDGPNFEFISYVNLAKTILSTTSDESEYMGRNR